MPPDFSNILDYNPAPADEYDPLEHSLVPMYPEEVYSNVNYILNVLPLNVRWNTDVIMTAHVLAVRFWKRNKKEKISTQEILTSIGCSNSVWLTDQIERMIVSFF